MPKEQILVVDDEQDIQELVGYNLKREGYQVTTAFTGEDAMSRARSERPDLIILDLLLPGIDGLEVCKALKNDPDTCQLPIIMLTAKGEESDIITGLELGADDYLTKPFSPRILIARIKAVFRRRKQEQSGEDGEVIKRGDLLIDTTRYQASLRGRQIDLTASEFRTLQYLAKRPGWVFTRNQIIDAVHGDDYPVTERSVDVHIVSLRKKLGEFGDKLETVRGIGYRLRED